MAIGGALRAALKAGNFTSAARESRRRARALAELNASGGIGRPGRARGADDYLRSRGVDVDSMTAPGTGNPYMDWVDEDFGPTFSDNPFGGVNFYNRGNRMRFAGEGADYNLPATLPTGSRYRGPIQAPYEGVRVLPGRVDEMGETLVRPGPWRGRGEGTFWDEGPINGFDNMDGSYWGSVFPSGFTPNSLLESAPWRMFANPRMTGGANRAISTGRRIGFDDIMNARGSLIRNRSEIPFSQYDIPF